MPADAPRFIVEVMRLIAFGLLGLVCCGSPASGTAASGDSAPGSAAAIAACQDVAGPAVDASDAVPAHRPDGGTCCATRAWADAVCAGVDAGEVCDFFSDCCVSCRR